MIRVGQAAPDFDANTTTGESVRLADMRGKRFVLYFFPKAFTSGWTVEASRFRDAYKEIVALGGDVIGVSTDKHETQCDFAKSLDLQFPMIGDSDKRIAKAYGVLFPIIGLDRRITFVIDEHGIVRGVFDYALFPYKHVDESLALLRDLASKAS